MKQKSEFNHRKKNICFTALVTVTDYVQPFYLEVRNSGQSILPTVAFQAIKKKKKKKPANESKKPQE